jgi:hypothetical protein
VYKNPVFDEYLKLFWCVLKWVAFKSEFLGLI